MTMYLSCLLIDVGTNPDRPRPGRLWLRNLYRVHQRLCMAFPFPETKTDDPAFLKPYNPSGFTALQAPRDTDNNFLFRIDPQPGGRVVILVLSAPKPDWDYAFQNALYLLAASAQELPPMKLSWQTDTQLRFRLTANPVYRATAKSVGPDGKPVDQKWVGKRVPVAPNEDAMRKWLEGKGPNCGFRLQSVSLVQPGYVYINKTRDRDKGQRLRSVRYEGQLEVTDTDSFRKTLVSGIGPGKAFGFGLLSIAPA